MKRPKNSSSSWLKFMILSKCKGRKTHKWLETISSFSWRIAKYWKHTCKGPQSSYVPFLYRDKQKQMATITSPRHWLRFVEVYNDIWTIMVQLSIFWNNSSFPCPDMPFTQEKGSYYAISAREYATSRSSLADAEEDLMFKRGEFGNKHPEILQKTVSWLLTLQFGFQAADESRKLN